MALNLSKKIDVKDIHHDQQFQLELTSHGSKLIIVEFFAFWCSPCKRIIPFFEEMASTYSEAVFLKVDVTRCRATPAAQGVSVLPTFNFYQNKIKIDTLEAENKTALEEMIKRYYVVDESGEDEESGVRGLIDLIGFVTTTKDKASNESDDHAFSDCMTPADGYLESDCDEQLILPMTFSQAVKIHSIKIKAPYENGPKTLRLFINQPSALDFDSAVTNQPVQEIVMTEEDLKGNLVNLNYVKFQNVQNLYVFVKDNQTGRETTRIDYFQLFGLPIVQANMNDIKLSGGKKEKEH